MTYEILKEGLAECEYVEVGTNGKHDRNFIFLGDLREKAGKSRIEV